MARRSVIGDICMGGLKDMYIRFHSLHLLKSTALFYPISAVVICFEVAPLYLTITGL
jgi:hypothetical protein